MFVNASLSTRETRRFKGGGVDYTPPTPPKPPAPADASTEAIKKLRADSKRRGLESTILTSGLGVQNTGLKTLLGG